MILIGVNHNHHKNLRSIKHKVLINLLKAAFRLLF